MTLTAKRFAQLAGAYGGDPDLWPDKDIAGAAAFMAAAPEAAQRILAEERRLDALLETHAAPMADAGLIRAVIAAAPRRRSPALRWVAGATLALACVSGLAVGTFFPPAAAVQWQNSAQADPLDDAGSLMGGADDEVTG